MFDWTPSSKSYDNFHQILDGNNSSFLWYVSYLNVSNNQQQHSKFYEKLSKIISSETYFYDYSNYLHLFELFAGWYISLFYEKILTLFFFFQHRRHKYSWLEGMDLGEK